LATGSYVLLLNSDTIVLEDVLPRSVGYMDEHPDVGVLGCRVLNVDRTVQLTCFRYPTLLNLGLKATGLFRLDWPHWFGREHLRGWQRDSEREVDVVTGCFMMVRRSAIDQVGLMDESFFFCGEETDWCTRFRRAGWKVRFAPVGEIIHIGNASGRQHRYQRDLMLSEGLVRLHRKHSGLLSAAIAWCLLLVFNASRAAFWCAASIVSPVPAYRDRRDHFLAVIWSLGRAWPTNGT
jgi:GT2 family glycosyltransferase